MRKLKPINDMDKGMIRVLFEAGKHSAEIRKTFKKYTLRQIAAVRGWMHRGKY